MKLNYFPLFIALCLLSQASIYSFHNDKHKKEYRAAQALKRAIQAPMSEKKIRLARNRLLKLKCSLTRIRIFTDRTSRSFPGSTRCKRYKTKNYAETIFDNLYQRLLTDEQADAYMAIKKISKLKPQLNVTPQLKSLMDYLIDCENTDTIEIITDVLERTKTINLPMIPCKNSDDKTPLEFATDTANLTLFNALMKHNAHITANVVKYAKSKKRSSIMKYLTTDKFKHQSRNKKNAKTIRHNDRIKRAATSLVKKRASHTVRKKIRSTTHRADYYAHWGGGYLG